MIKEVISLNILLFLGTRKIFFVLNEKRIDKNM